MMFILSGNTTINSKQTNKRENIYTSEISPQYNTKGTNEKKKNWKNIIF